MHTGSEAHLASCPKDTGGKVAWPGHEADHLPRLRMHGAIPPLPHTSSWHGAWLSTGTTLPL